MLEKKYLLKIMKEYNALLKKYEEKIENFTKENKWILTSKKEK